MLSSKNPFTQPSALASRLLLAPVTPSTLLYSVLAFPRKLPRCADPGVGRSVECARGSRPCGRAGLAASHSPRWADQPQHKIRAPENADLSGHPRGYSRRLPTPEPPALVP